MANNERVYLVDDDRMIHVMVDAALEDTTHQIVERDFTLSATLKKIPTLAGKISVAFVDGNLTAGDNSGNDGLVVTKALRELQPPVTVIGFSSNPVNYGDLFISKRDFRMGNPAGRIDTVLDGITR